MAKSLTNPTFDYALVDKDTTNKLIWYEGELSRSRKRVADELIEHGKILYEAQQDLADYSNGVFVAWLASAGISTRSAYNAINAYLEFGGFANLQNLEVSAMYALTACDPPARKAAMRLADKGVKVTHAMAKKLIKEETSVDSGEEGRTDSDGTDTQETAPRPPRKRGTKPPKRLDRGAYYKQYDNAIGPLVRLVDKIADGVGESRNGHHRDVQEHLNDATDCMREWMQIK